MVLTRTHGIGKDLWYRQQLMVLTTLIVSTKIHGIESVLVNHTHTRGPSVARMRDFFKQSGRASWWRACYQPGLCMYVCMYVFRENTLSGTVYVNLCTILMQVETMNINEGGYLTCCLSIIIIRKYGPLRGLRPMPRLFCTSGKKKSLLCCFGPFFGAQ